MKRRALSPDATPRAIPMARIQQSSSPQPCSDGQDNEKRKHSVNSPQLANSSSSQRALRFDLPPNNNETDNQDSASSVSWLEKLSYVEETPPMPALRFGTAGEDDDMDKLLQAGPRFADLIRSTSTDGGAVESLSHRFEPQTAADAEPSPVPISAIAPSAGNAGRIGGRFDEDEIRNRRRHHYRAHQPLKSLEPKVLRKVKDRIEWGRSQAQLARTAGVQKAPELVSNHDEEHPAIENTTGSNSMRPHGSRRRRRRRRHRSKKAEPFQPTLGHVSEEQHSSLEIEEEDADQESADDVEEEEEEDIDEEEETETEDRMMDDEEDPELIRIINADDSVDGGRMDVPEDSGSPGKLAVGRVNSADGRRPSFHLGGDSTRNSEVNLQGMVSAKSPNQMRQSSVESDREGVSYRRTASSDCLTPGEKENNDTGKHSNSRSGHRHHREHFSKKDLQERCFSGAELRQITEAQRSNSQAPTEPEEAQCLKAKDLDEMNYHRLEKHQLKHHRHKPPSSSSRLPSSVMSVVEVGHMEHPDDGTKTPLPGILVTSPSSSQFRGGVDHTPHDVFVELDELTLTDRNHHYQWNEKARWIRFEEDLVEGGERWGKPHVAPLSFHSLLQMRNLLESATFIKDLEANDLVDIADSVSTQLLRTHSASAEEAEFVRKMLLLKHSHVGGSHHHHHASGKRSSGMIPMQERIPTSPAGFMPHTVVDDGHYPKLTSNSTAPTQLASQVNGQPAYNNGRRRSSIGQRLTNLLRRGSTPAACFDKGVQSLHNDDSSIGDHIQIPMETDMKLGGSLSAGSNKHKRSFLDMIRHSGGVNDLLTDDCEVVSSLVGSCPFISQTRTVLIRLAQGLNLPKLSEVDRPIRFIFLFLVNNQLVREYSPREIGRAFATLMADKDFHEIAYKAACREDMLAGLRDFLEKSIVLPPGDWDRQTLLPVVNYQRELMNEAKKNQQLQAADGGYGEGFHRPANQYDGASEELEPLMSTETDRASHVPGSEKDFGTPGLVSEDGRSVKTDDVKVRRFKNICHPFSGLRNDLRRLGRRYPGDWTDPVRKGGLVDVLIASLFVFFVALAPAITFGALLESLVNEIMSMDKSLVSAGGFLILLTLVGGQPQIIVGITGPVFIIETTISMIATTMEVDYVCLRFLVGIFASTAGLFFTAFNLASFLEIVPRSLEEIFNMFVAIFFIFKSCVTVLRPITNGMYLNIIDNTTALRVEYNSSLVLVDAYQHFASSNSTALIAIGTYLLVQTLSNVKKGRMFTRRVRWFLGSFSVPMAILVMTGIGNLLYGLYPLKTLQIPPSASNPATWISMPNFSLIAKMSVSSWLLAALIGICLHLLTFTETGICGLTLSKREQGTKKPTLFHLNVLIVNTIFPVISGFCCWPFVTGAVVRSNAHTMALQVWEDKTLPGVRRKLVGVREQRISGCMVGLLVFLCVFLGPSVLKYIPMGAMYGMFFYMGVSSFRGLQLVTRTKALLVRRRYWPEVAYLEAPLKILWIFTMIEWTFVALLFILNCLTEFAQMSYPSLFFPVILVLYGFIRLVLLTRWSLLSDKLRVIDKNHGIRVNEVESDDSGKGYQHGDMESEVKSISRAHTPNNNNARLAGISSDVYESSEDEMEEDENERNFYINTDRP